jgi:hypothetical protein
VVRLPEITGPAAAWHTLPPQVRLPKCRVYIVFKLQDILENRIFEVMVVVSRVWFDIRVNRKTNILASVSLGVLVCFSSPRRSACGFCKEPVTNTEKHKSSLQGLNNKRYISS